MYVVVWKPFRVLWAFRPQRRRFDSLELLVLPGVGDPKNDRAAKAMRKRLSQMDLHGMTVLDIGCGSGLQSCVAARQRAEVHACDIHVQACKNTRTNAERNGLQLEVYHSDLFDQLPDELRFEWIVSVPPTIPRYPEDELDFAFCCGERLEFFHGLFARLAHRLKPRGRLLMTLPRNAVGREVLAIARERGFGNRVLHRFGGMIRGGKLYEFSASI